MPLELTGSCRCGAASFAVVSHTPYPYQLCYCTICRKTGGGGGFAINVMGDAKTLKIESERSLGLYKAQIFDAKAGACVTSTGQRRFCIACGSALWLFDPEWPDLVHPFASAIDTDLPVPPRRTHLMLRYKASWVVPSVGPDDLCYDDYPEQSIEEWHRQHRLWLD